VRNGEWRDKLTLWTSAHRVVPDSITTALAAAEQLRRAGDLEGARRVVERGLAVRAPSSLTQSIEDSLRPSLLLLRGQIRRDDGDLAGAEADIRAAMAERPDRNDWRSELANVLAMDGRLEEALKEIEAALVHASDADERRVLEGRREKLRRALAAPRAGP
jgi:tetratricopeptide (TPR) repeat protein